MYRKVLLFVVSLALIQQIQLVNGVLKKIKCEVKIKVGLPSKKDPVYLKPGDDTQLMVPEKGALAWNFGMQLTTLVCSGFSNKILFKGSILPGMNNLQHAIIKCDSRNKFKVDKFSVLNYNLEDITCLHAVTGDILKKSTKCANNVGTQLEIGFNGPNGMIPYIKSCYNMAKGSVIYTQHTLYGKEINYKVKESTRPAFKSAETPEGLTPTESYKIDSQIKRFTTLLGDDEAKQYVGSSFLAKGHMTPDGDGVLKTWQHATYFFTNVIPQWQIVNNGNWKLVEDIVRKTADMLQEAVQIFTGVYDILTLPDENNNPVEIALEGAKKYKGKNVKESIEVPKWMYKIIKSTDKKAAIAFVTLNNPFVTPCEVIDFPCTDICAAYGWQNTKYSIFKKGYTICCSVADLRNTVTDVPEDALATYILNVNGDAVSQVGSMMSI